jgi:hypothetical protein
MNNTPSNTNTQRSGLGTFSGVAVGCGILAVLFGLFLGERGILKVGLWAIFAGFVGLIFSRG